MTATWSPGSISRQHTTKFASALPLVTRICSGDTPGESAGILLPNTSVPLHRLVPGRNPRAHHDVRPRAAARHENLLGRHARVERGDLAPQQVGAVRLAVAEPHVEQRIAGRSPEVQQLAD